MARGPVLHLHQGNCRGSTDGIKPLEKQQTFTGRERTCESPDSWLSRFPKLEKKTSALALKAPRVSRASG